MSLLKQEFLQYQELYNEKLEALQHQQLVIHTLESMLWKKVPPRNLFQDSSTETDPVDFSTQSMYLQVINLKIRIERMRERRRVAREEQKRQLAMLQSIKQDMQQKLEKVLLPGQTFESLMADYRAATKKKPRQKEEIDRE